MASGILSTVVCWYANSKITQFFWIWLHKKIKKIISPIRTNIIYFVCDVTEWILFHLWRHREFDLICDVTEWTRRFNGIWFLKTSKSTRKKRARIQILAWLLFPSRSLQVYGSVKMEFQLLQYDMKLSSCRKIELLNKRLLLEMWSQHMHYAICDRLIQS